jgi:hypothetical protein
MAHGGALTLAVNGTFDHEDRQAIDAARPVFRWAAENEQFYTGQQSAARVLLLGNPASTGRSYSQASYRGLFRFLSEEHIPFAVSDNMDWLGKREFDLVLAADWAPPELSQYIAKGGRALIVSPRVPEIPTPRVITTHTDVESYMRIRNHEMFPSLSATNLVMLDGDYTEVEGDGSASLSFVPPSMYGPPEKIHVDFTNTNKPGLAFFSDGRAAWIPWDLAGMYYRHSLPAHAALLRDVVNRMLPDRQIRTNAHPLLEMVLMRQAGRTLLHLVNLSGHSDTAYFAPLPTSDIRVDVAGAFKHARTVHSVGKLPVTVSGGRTSFTVPRLSDYELVVLE